MAGFPHPLWSEGFDGRLVGRGQVGVGMIRLEARKCPSLEHRRHALRIGIWFAKHQGSGILAKGLDLLFDPRINFGWIISLGGKPEK